MKRFVECAYWKHLNEMVPISTRHIIMIGICIRPVKQNFQRKNVIIFLSTSLNMCFGYSKKTSLWDGSFEYPQHLFWLRNKKNDFQLLTLIWGYVFGRDLMIFVNSLVPDQDQQSFGPDLDPNHVTPLIVYQKDSF